MPLPLGPYNSPTGNPQLNFHSTATSKATAWTQWYQRTMEPGFLSHSGEEECLTHAGL